MPHSWQSMKPLMIRNFEEPRNSCQSAWHQSSVSHVIVQRSPSREIFNPTVSAWSGLQIRHPNKTRSDSTSTLDRSAGCHPQGAWTHGWHHAVDKAECRMESEEESASAFGLHTRVSRIARGTARNTDRRFQHRCHHQIDIRLAHILQPAQLKAHHWDRQLCERLGLMSNAHLLSVSKAALSLHRMILALSKRL